jgi:site-specific recombinase XerC
MRIEDALGRFLTQLEADGRSIHTRKQYRRHVRLLATWARDVGHCGDDIERLGHEDVAAFLAAPAATGHAGGGPKLATSANCLRSSLKGFFSYLHRAGFIAHDPGRLIRRALCAPPPPKALSEDEQTRLLDVLSKATGVEGERDHALFHLMLASGIRLTSALEINREDVDLDKSEIRLRHTKGDRRDTVFLGKAIVEHLGRYLAVRTSGAIFTGRDDRRVTSRHAQRRFGEWVRAAGITRRVSPHALRHSFGMRIYAKTGDLLLTKEALRHRSVASTLVYARADEARLRRAL